MRFTADFANEGPYSTLRDHGSLSIIGASHRFPFCSKGTGLLLPWAAGFDQLPLVTVGLAPVCRLHATPGRLTSSKR